ncbi:MAG: WYL domain-containing protein [Leptospirales bacterium]|jgi:predicted DNA-binding transcriptional regulator YafY
MDKLERIAVLYLTFLGHPGGLSFAQLREYLPEVYSAGPGEDPESMRRKFERDKDELRSLGMDLRHHAAGEALSDGSLASHSIYVVADELQRSPAVDLSRSEVHTLAAILMAALGSSGEDTASDVDPALLESAAYKLLYKHPALLQNSDTSARKAPRSWRESAPAVTEHLSRIHEGLARRRSLDIDYTNKTGSGDSRRVDGRGLISHRGRWCLVAYCHRARDIRMFYVDRVARVELSDQEYPADRAFDLKQYSLHPLALRIEAPLEIRVFVDPEREESLLDFLSGLPDSAGVTQNSAESEIRLTTTNPQAFFSWMMRHPGSILRLGPAATHARFVDYLAALRANYADGADQIYEEPETAAGGATK